ncbi:MAG: MBL fold metallo-hydrolase, partial [Gemmatimonadales bacterium]
TACAANDVAEETAEVPEPAAAEPMLTGEQIPTDVGDLIIQPIQHATFAMEWDGKIVYVDPVGGAEAFEGLPSPDLILITDIHGDHLNAETLEAVATEDVVIIAPAAVVEQLPPGLGGEVRTLANGDETSLLDLSVEAIPMYNLTEDRLQYHERGRGNGYVVTLGGRRIYISGDTEDIPEMRALENIDVAFVDVRVLGWY